MNAELLTVKETATFLRTTPKAIYNMIERGQLPGVVRLGRRVLVRSVDLRKHLGLPPIVLADEKSLALATEPAAASKETAAVLRVSSSRQGT